MQLTIDELREVNIKLSLRQNVLDACNTLSRQFSINTFLRIAHFMAQVCHESNGFRITVENLNLHNPPRLMLIWPGRFPAIGTACP